MCHSKTKQHKIFLNTIVGLMSKAMEVVYRYFTQLKVLIQQCKSPAFKILVKVQKYYQLLKESNLKVVVLE